MPKAWLMPATERAASEAVVSGGNDDAPGRLADGNRLRDIEGSDVDDRHVVTDAVGSEKEFLVGRKVGMPDALADQEIFFDVVSRLVHDSDAVGRAEADESVFAVRGEVDADRLDRGFRHLRQIEVESFEYFVRGDIDDGRRCRRLPKRPTASIRLS